MKVLVIVVTTLLCGLSHTARASGGADVQGVACVPYSGTNNAGYQNTNSGVTFENFETGGLDFSCAIPNAQQMSSPTTLSILYTDDTGTTGNTIEVSYYKISKATGALTRIASIISNTGCATGAFKTCSTTFTDTFSPSTYLYFIDATIERQTDTPNEVFYGASLR